MREHAHQWGMWLGYDPMIIEMGITHGFTYRRECMVSGCTTIEKAVGLAPVGETKILDHPKTYHVEYGHPGIRSVTTEVQSSDTTHAGSMMTAALNLLKK